MKIAISGSIGSGKSEACNYLRSIGYDVFDCDAVNARLLEKGNEGYLEVRKHFPECFEEDELNKKKLSALVFSDDQKRKELDIPAGKFARYIASLLAVTILLTAPFYIFTASRISSGTDASNVEFVTKKIYRGKSHLDRFVCSCRFFMLKLQAGQENVSSAKWVELDKSRHWGYTIYKLYDKQIIPGLLMLIFNIYVLYCSWCKRREYPGIMLCAVVFTLIWSVFFCYDLRNLALAFPWIVLMEAVAVCNFFESRIGAGSLKNLNFWQAAVAAGLLCWLFMPEVFDNDRRIRKFNTAKMQAGYPQLNTIIYEWAAADKTHRRIVTDYIYGVLLPEINNRFENCTFMDRQEFMDKFDLPSSGAVLIPRYADPSIREFVREQLEKGSLRESFSFQEYTFYEKTGSNN